MDKNDIEFLYNGDLGTLQSKTQSNMKIIECLLTNHIIDTEDAIKMKKDVIKYFTQEIAKILVNPISYINN